MPQLEPSSATSPQTAFRQGWMSRWLWLGSVWLWVGMALAPVNARVWNPGKYYHESLLLLYLPPVLWLLWQTRSEWPRSLAHNSGTRWIAALLVWAGIGVGWSNHTHLGDALLMELSIGLFVISTAVLLVRDAEAWWRMLFWAAIGIALAALLAMLSFPFRHVVWEGANRLVAFGTWNNPNLAGMGAGAAWLWLLLTAIDDWRRQWLRGVAVLVLTVFVGWTFSRASWLALTVAAVSGWLLRWRHDTSAASRFRWLLLLLPLLVWAGWRYIVMRGWSHRPEILQQALQHIARVPWTGEGTFSRYQIVVAGEHWEHSHNVWTHMAITLGVPGLLLWAGLWIWVALSGWRRRSSWQGQSLLVLWVYGSVATLFDAPLLLVQPDVEWCLLWLPIALAVGLSLRQPAAAQQVR